MAPELYIPSCIREPAHPFHPPPLGKPLRIQIEGPLVSVKKLLPDTPWHVSYILTSFPQIAGPLLAKLTFEKIYGHPVRPDVEGDLVVRDEYLGWVREVRPRKSPLIMSVSEIDYYGVTFDHLVPADDPNPEVLQININEMDDDEGAGGLGGHGVRAQAGVVRGADGACVDDDVDGHLHRREEVAVRSSNTDVLISWRLLGLDPNDIAFNLYRTTSNDNRVKLNTAALRGGTNFVDRSADLTRENTYMIRPVVDGQEGAVGGTFALHADNAVEPVVRVTIRKGDPIKFVWVGDLDGDEGYDYILDRQTSPQLLEAYASNGTFLWQVNVGPNSESQDKISPGSSANNLGHWDGVTVYDFNNDGLAEVAVRIVNGVTFGDGQRFTHANDDEHFIAIPTDYISDGPLAARFGVGYLDGRQPSLVAYMKNRKDDGDFNLLMSAWSFSGTALKMQWKWRRESRDAPDGHSTRIIDVDGDGRDEVHESGFTLHGDGQLRYSLGPQGVVHGDRFHIA
ncbi:fg-gap repeat family protein [Verticillium dahliae]